MNRWLAAGLLFLANALWGTSYAIAKVALEELPPPLLGAIRFSIASALLWIIVLVQRRSSAAKASPTMDRRDAWRILGLGVVAIAGTHLISNLGQSLTTATDASLMIVGEVIFTTLLGAWILKERPGPWRRVGVVIGGIGAVTLILNSAQSGDGAVSGLTRAAGDSLVLLGLVGEALYSIIGVKYVRRYSHLKVTALVNTGSLVVWVPVLVYYIATGQVPWGAWTALGGVVYLAVINSVICFLIWFKVLESAPANFGAISLFAQPLVGALLGLTLLGEKVTPGLLAGAALILTALFFATRPEKSGQHDAAA
ncbi:MAG TPA: DMT family transporter [Symbiobacteriaceae bacterium]|nr:DMT family transporter [Symbiobacteriaceae bacterium]